MFAGIGEGSHVTALAGIGRGGEVSYVTLSAGMGGGEGGEVSHVTVCVALGRVRPQPKMHI